jgi:hypothetical protein
VLFPCGGCEKLCAGGVVEGRCTGGLNEVEAFERLEHISSDWANDVAFKCLRSIGYIGLCEDSL